MKIKLILFAIFSNVLIFSCSSKYERETIIFKQYLTENFNLKLNSNQEVFFIIPGIRCGGCSDFLQQKISKLSFNAKLITTTKPQVSFPANIDVFIDKKRNIDRIDLGVSNTFIIVCENGKIEQITEISPENFQMIIKQFKSSDIIRIQ
jgi:hypothetical protein